MTQLTTIKTKGGATVAAVGVAALVAACGSSGHASRSASASGTPASDHTLQLSISHGHLIGPRDRATYLWEADRHDRSNCRGACAAAWPPVLTKARPTAGSGLKAADLSTIRRGGERQVTYAGHPLYYFAGDGRGTTRGQGSDGFGARWWLVAASGSAVTSHASGGKSSSGSGSGGGW
jgi:predicted lipoprotein with Yx(FWY)xxD motif